MGKRGLSRLLWLGILASLLLTLLGVWNPRLQVAGYALSGVARVGLASFLGFRGLTCLWDSELPWTRALLPLVASAELLGTIFQGSRAWQLLRLGTVGLLELFVLFRVFQAFRVRSEDSPEQAITDGLSSLLPPRAARLIALEAVCLSGAVAHLFGGWRRPLPPGFAYHRSSHLAMLLPALPLLLPADFVLVGLMVRSAPLWVKLLVHALSLYSVLWVLGLWAAFRSRPHLIEGGNMSFRLGFLFSLGVAPGQVARWQGLADDPDLLSQLRKAGAARCHLSGNAVFQLELEPPQQPLGFLGPGKPIRCVLVGVDDAEGFSKALADFTGLSPA